MLRPDRFEKCQAVPGEQVAGRLDAREIDSFPAADSPAGLVSLERLAETLQRLTHRLDLDGQGLGHVVSPVIRLTSLVKSERSRSTSTNA